MTHGFHAPASHHGGQSQSASILVIVAAGVGVILLGAFGGLFYLLTRGQERASRVIRRVAGRIRFLDADRTTCAGRAVGRSVRRPHAGPLPDPAGHRLGRGQLAARRGLAVGVRGRLQPLHLAGRPAHGLRTGQHPGRHPHHPGRARRGRVRAGVDDHRLRAHRGPGPLRPCWPTGPSTSGSPSPSAGWPTPPWSSSAGRATASSRTSSADASSLRRRTARPPSAPSVAPVGQRHRRRGAQRRHHGRGAARRPGSTAVRDLRRVTIRGRPRPRTVPAGGARSGASGTGAGALRGPGYRPAHVTASPAAGEGLRLELILQAEPEAVGREVGRRPRIQRPSAPQLPRVGLVEQGPVEEAGHPTLQARDRRWAPPPPPGGRGCAPSGRPSPRHTRSGRPASPPKQKTRECSRYRPTMDRTRMPLGQPGNAGSEAAPAPHHQVDRHPGLRGPVEGVDHLRVGETVGLEDDPPVGAGPAPRRSMASSSPARVDNGETSRRRNLGGSPDPDSRLNSSPTSAPMSGSAVNRPRSS